MAARRASKTLPRGFSLANARDSMSSTDCADVFGLYGELLNVRDYDCDSGDLTRQGDDLRRSDPELSTIPYRVNTLDRRVRMKTSRPRSLDMSSWSVQSRDSAHTNTSSSSDAGSERPSPSVSRNASFQSSASGASSVSTAASSIIVSNGNQPPSAHSTPAKANTAPAPLRQTQSAAANSAAPAKPPDGTQTRRSKKADAPRTVITLMGGRGYINWRRVTAATAAAASGKGSSSAAAAAAAIAQINNCDAYMVMWEMKL